MHYLMDHVNYGPQNMNRMNPQRSFCAINSFIHFLSFCCHATFSNHILIMKLPRARAIAVSLNFASSLALVTSFSVFDPVSCSTNARPNPLINTKRTVSKLSVLTEPTGNENGNDNQIDLDRISSLLSQFLGDGDSFLKFQSTAKSEGALLKSIATDPNKRGEQNLAFSEADDLRNTKAQECAGADAYAHAHDANLQRVWSEMYNLEDERYTENVAMEMQLNISLDDFSKQFLEDDAPISLESLHRAAGDSNVKSTRWENPMHQTETETETETETGTRSAIIKKRHVTYNHPIKMPLPKAPPSGSATKTQTMRRFGDIGICLDSETWINDIPLASSFYVVDRLVARSHRGGGILLTIQFGNCFVKRTMFRRIIAAASVSEVSHFLRGYLDSIRKSIED